MIGGAVLALVALAPTARAQSASQEEVLRIYDVRDLAAILPDDVDAPSGRSRSGGRGQSVFGARGGAGGAGGGGGGAGGGGGGGGSLFGDPRDPVPAHRLVDRLCTAIGLEYEPLLRGIVSAQGTIARHDQLAEQLREVRRLFTERYEVELACFSVSASSAPELGAPINELEPDLFSRQVIVRRQPTTIRSVTSHTYLADLVVVTGDSAVGYQPQSRMLDDGLTLELLIGAGDEDERATPLEASGELTRVAFSRSPVELPGRPDSPPAVELPSVDRRTIQTAVSIEYDKLVTIAVLPGFESGTAVVVAARVRKQ
jgi:hypothetical protein